MRLFPLWDRHSRSTANIYERGLGSSSQAFMVHTDSYLQLLTNSQNEAIKSLFYEIGIQKADVDSRVDEW